MSFLFTKDRQEKLAAFVFDPAALAADQILTAVSDDGGGFVIQAIEASLATVGVADGAPGNVLKWVVDDEGVGSWQAAAGGDVENLSDLGDVGTAGGLAPSDGQVLQWSEADSAWIAGSGAGGDDPVNLGELGDVATAGAAAGQALIASVDDEGAVSWAPGNLDFIVSSAACATITSGMMDNWDEAHGWGNHASAGYLSSLPSGVVALAGDPAADQVGKILGWSTNDDGDLFWDLFDPPAGGAVDSVDGLTGAVDLSSSYQPILPTGANGQILVYNDTAEAWLAADAPDGGDPLPSGAVGQILVHDGAAWEADDPSWPNIPDGSSAGDLLVWTVSEGVGAWVAQADDDDGDGDGGANDQYLCQPGMVDDPEPGSVDAPVWTDGDGGAKTLNTATAWSMCQNNSTGAVVLIVPNFDDSEAFCRKIVISDVLDLPEDRKISVTVAGNGGAAGTIDGAASEDIWGGASLTIVCMGARVDDDATKGLMWKII